MRLPTFTCMLGHYPERSTGFSEFLRKSRASKGLVKFRQIPGQRRKQATARVQKHRRLEAGISRGRRLIGLRGTAQTAGTTIVLRS